MLSTSIDSSFYFWFLLYCPCQTKSIKIVSAAGTAMKRSASFLMKSFESARRIVSFQHHSKTSRSTSFVSFSDSDGCETGKEECRGSNKCRKGQINTVPSSLATTECSAVSASPEPNEEERVHRKTSRQICETPCIIQ